MKDPTEAKQAAHEARKQDGIANRSSQMAVDLCEECEVGTARGLAEMTDLATALGKIVRAANHAALAAERAQEAASGIVSGHRARDVASEADADQAAASASTAAQIAWQQVTDMGQMIQELANQRITEIANQADQAALGRAAADADANEVEEEGTR